ncbi:MAG: transposase [Pseudonocardiales bacterium]|nr:transposase [Pseudonocardiales bacterium]
MTLKDNAVAAPPTITDDPLDRWRAGFKEMFALVAGRFAQVESRRRARMYVLGLLSGAERTKSWTIAEAAGDASPDGMQRLMNFYSWDADAVRDDLRGYVLNRLGDSSGVMVADETGFLKKGNCRTIRTIVRPMSSQRHRTRLKEFATKLIVPAIATPTRVTKMGPLTQPPRLFAGDRCRSRLRNADHLARLPLREFPPPRPAGACLA